MRGIMNPNSRAVKNWNKFFLAACLLTLFLDLSFFFVYYVDMDHKCILIDLTELKTLTILRSVADVLHLLNMFLQFRLAYIAPIGPLRMLVTDPNKIAVNYVRGDFFRDLFVLLPFTQIILWLDFSWGNDDQIFFLIASVLLQSSARVRRLLPLLKAQTAIVRFNLAIVLSLLTTHFVGSCRYILDLQMVNECLVEACRYSGFSEIECASFTRCGNGQKLSRAPISWMNNINANLCLP